MTNLVFTDGTPIPPTKAKRESNELSVKAKGGTELMLGRLHDSLDPELLENFQIIPSRVRDIDSSRKTILWLHDLPSDPESQHLSNPDSRANFEKMVFVSDWQMQYYNLALGVPYKDSIVLKNAIEPIEVPTDQEFDGTVRLIYHTTPHRGLEILVPVFEALCKKIPNIHLDVYSSFKIYGWEQRDEPYKDLFKRIEDHPKMTNHGTVSNNEVRTALGKAHIFAYPCIWTETSCLAAIEALSAKCQVVCPNLGALPETCSNWAQMYQWNEDVQEHAQLFAENLAGAINHVSSVYELNDSKNTNRLNVQKQYIDNFYSWAGRKLQWEALLKGLL